MNKWLKLKKFIEDIEPDVEKFYNRGFDDTGKRVTVGMQQLKVLAHEVRVDILTHRKVNKIRKNRKKNGV